MSKLTYTMEEEEYKEYQLLLKRFDQEVEKKVKGIKEEEKGESKLLFRYDII